MCVCPSVLWKISSIFADWLSSPTNFLFASSSPPLLDAASAVLELGCGISPLNAFALAPRVASHTLTDQAYVQRLLQRTLDDNLPLPSPSSSSSSRRSRPKPGRHLSSGAVSFETLDWETDELPRGRSYDAVLACDCVYNYALIPPLVQTCVDACRRRRQREEEEEEQESGGAGGAGGGEDAKRPSLCIVAQQLRNDDVFKSWLEAFVKEFRVWRVADDRLPETLRPSAGFVIHVGILRE